MKTQDRQDNDKERVPINQEMDKQPNRGKRKCDDDEDDQKPTVNPKNGIPDKDNQDDHDQDNQDNNEQEMIKRECINKMFKRHFKSNLGPQDNDDEPHPAIAHLYAVHITETMNVLQAMVHYQWQLLDLYHTKTHQDPFYLPYSE